MNNMGGLQELRRLLKDAPERAIVMLSSPDGLCTNSHGFKNFFDEFSDKEVVLVHCPSSGEIDEIDLKTITHLIAQLEQGLVPKEQTPATVFVDLMVKSGLNKML
jgi:hypothetical protein